jgi:hypothetical protein
MSTAAAQETLLSPPRTAVAHAWLSTEIYRLLEREANALRMHPDRLAGDLIAAIVGGGLVATVLGR